MKARNIVLCSTSLWALCTASMAIANDDVGPSGVSVTTAAVQTSAGVETLEDTEANVRTGSNNMLVVTATRRSETLQTVPISITALSAEDVIARGITNVDELADSTPNLWVRPAAATANTALITMRGLSQRDNLATVDQAVGVYVDDIYLARAYSALSELLDVQRVEVLRGPQGTLFGRNTIGGAIRVITRRPDVDEGLTGNVYATIGNYDYYEIGGAATVPIVDGSLALRVAGMMRSRDGYTNSILVNEPFVGPQSIIRTIDSDDSNAYTFRATLGWEPGPDTRLDLSYYVFNDENNGAAIANVFGDIGNINGPGFTNFRNSTFRANDFYSVLTNTVPFADVQTEIFAANFEHQFSEALTFRLIGSYVDSRNHSGLNSDGLVTDSVTLLQFEPDLTQLQDQWTFEAQLFGTVFGGALDYIGGIYYFEEDGFEFGPGTSRVFGSGANAVDFTGSAANESVSGFLSLSVHPVDRLTLRAGARYTEDTKAIEGRNRNFQTQICSYAPGPGIVTSITPNGPCSLTQSDSFNYWIWDLGIDYEFTDGMFAYVKISNGFRSGGQQLRAVNFTSGQPFEPDEVISYEAGLKMELFDVLTLNSAVYHTDYSNVQQSIILSPPLTPTTTTQVVNQGNADVEGFEIEAVLIPFDGLTISGAVGHTDFEFAGSTIVQIYSPRWQYNLSATYEFPIGDGANARANVFYDHSSRIFSDPNPLRPGSEIEGPGLLGARLAVEFENGLEISLWGRNLTGEDYFTYSTVSGNVAGAGLGQPRTYGATARFNF